MTDRPGLDFSFSGLKTQVLLAWQAQRPFRADQGRCRARVRGRDRRHARDQVPPRARGDRRRARWSSPAASARTSAARTGSPKPATKEGFRTYFPRPEFCTDNGAMIALAGAHATAGGPARDAGDQGAPALGSRIAAAAGVDPDATQPVVPAKAGAEFFRSRMYAQAALPSQSGLRGNDDPVSLNANPESRIPNPESRIPNPDPESRMDSSSSKTCASNRRRHLRLGTPHAPDHRARYRDGFRQHEAGGKRRDRRHAQLQGRLEAADRVRRRLELPARRDAGRALRCADLERNSASRGSGSGSPSRVPFAARARSAS